MTTDPNAFLMGNGGRSAKFEAKGDSVRGVVMSLRVVQQTDFKTKRPLFWDNGDPRMQLAVTLMTEEQEDENDDSLRTVYVRGQMQQAVREAVRVAGEQGLAEGGTLAVQYVGDGEARNGGYPPKQYRAKYEAPSRTVAVPAGDDDGDLPPF